MNIVFICYKIAQNDLILILMEPWIVLKILTNLCRINERRIIFIFTG